MGAEKGLFTEEKVARGRRSPSPGGLCKVFKLTVFSHRPAIWRPHAYGRDISATNGVAHHPEGQRGARKKGEPRKRQSLRKKKQHGGGEREWGLILGGAPESRRCKEKKGVSVERDRSEKNSREQEENIQRSFSSCEGPRKKNCCNSKKGGEEKAILRFVNRAERGKKTRPQTVGQERESTTITKDQKRSQGGGEKSARKKKETYVREEENSSCRTVPPPPPFEKNLQQGGSSGAKKCLKRGQGKGPIKSNWPRQEKGKVQTGRKKPVQRKKRLHIEERDHGDIIAQEGKGGFL